MSQELLSCRGPPPSYSVFLYEQMPLSKLKTLKEVRSHQLFTVAQFLDTLSQSDFFEQNMLCELYLHEVDHPMNIQFKGIHLF